MRAALAAVAVFLVGCGGKTPEERSVDLLNEMADVLESIKDGKTADAAVKKLEALGDEGRALQEEMEGRPDEASAETRKAFEAAQRRMMRAMQKAMSIPGAREAIEAIDKK